MSPVRRTLRALRGRGTTPGFTAIAAGASHAVAIVGFPRGDLNCDRHIDFDDINPFVLSLSDPAGYQTEYPGCNALNADGNADGFVDFDDINPFVALLSGGGK